jgi:tetratricopeptide (TPR) repeat protein
MKKLIIAIWTVLLTPALTGQQTAEYIMKARAFCAGGNSDQAVRLLTEVISVSGDARLYIERAEANLAQRRYSEAIADLNEANRISASSGEYGLARAYAMKGDAATSLYHLGLSMNSPSRHSEKEIVLDPVFSSMENRTEWRQFWKKEWYTEADKSISEIEYCISSGKTEDARSALDELKSNYPGSDDAIYGAAMIDLSAGKYSDAIKGLTTLTADNPDKEKYLVLLAKAQALGGNPAGATETFSRLFTAGYADASMLLQRAECYRKTGETDKALKDVELYLGMYPGDREANSLAAKIEAGSGDTMKALDYYTKNLKLHPNDPECYIERANAYFASKSWDWAANDYSMSLDLSPSNPDVWLRKGMALLNMGDVDDACHDFRRALSLGNKKATEYISSNCIK